ncbi:MAG: hypothetical protein QXS20_08990 [Candidatus Thorarchaeota archaeon]
MDWLAKIIHGRPDEFVHARLLKYGVGEHVGPTIRLVLSQKKVDFKGDLDTEKFFIRAYVGGVAGGLHKVSGTIITYTDRTAEFARLPIPLEWSKSKDQGATTYKTKLRETMPFAHLQQLIACDGPTTFFLLTLEPADGTKPWKVTTKSSFPKGLGANIEGEDEDKVPSFTRGSLGRTPEVDDMIMTELLSDFREHISTKTKNVTIRSDIVVESIEAPDDPALSIQERRRLAKKTGRLIRKANIDGTEYTCEHRFKA